MQDRTVSPETSSAAPRISLPHLLLVFLKVGSIGFGGGMAIISVIASLLIMSAAE